MVDIANKIKSSITMKDIATKYDFPVDNKNFICCPFHDEKTASLKIYLNDKGWHCFGCGEGGSVIDFVMKLYDIKFMDACRKINEDFQLGIIEEYKQNPQNIKALSEKYREKRLKRYEKEQALKEFNHYVGQYAIIKDIAAKANEYDTIDLLPDDIIEAIKDLNIAEHYLDCADEKLRRIANDSPISQRTIFR